MPLPLGGQPMSNNVITIGSSTLTAEVSPLGAELQSLRTSAGQDVLWHGGNEFWTGRAPILFPIVGRAPQDRISIGTFSAEMKQHGFARKSMFALDEHTQDMCRFILKDNADTRAQYPFAFRLAVTHKIIGSSLQTRVEITNKSDRPMPFGFGFHPAFVWPLPGAEHQPHSIVLDNQAEPELARLKDGLLPPDRLTSPFSKGRLKLDHSQFEHDAMIFPKGAGDALTYGAINDADDVINGTALVFTFENLPNLALWTKPNAPFICIEPWHGMAATTQGSDQIADRPNSVLLDPNATERFAVTVAVSL